MLASKKIRLVVGVVVVATAFVMNSCGGKKTTQQQQAQVAAQGGFQTVTSPVSELEDLKAQLERQNMPCGIGIGESTSERVARSTSADHARADLATSMEATVQRLSESYFQNIGVEAKGMWEEATRTLTNQQLRGTNVFKTIPQFNQENGVWKIYSLVVLNPEIFKAAMAEAFDRAEEYELRVKKDDMLSKMDAQIAEYNSKYKK